MEFQFRKRQDTACPSLRFNVRIFWVLLEQGPFFFWMLTFLSFLFIKKGEELHVASWAYEGIDFLRVLLIKWGINHLWGT